MTIGERVVADAARAVFVLPEDRNLGLVLQNYALWPHLTVRQNVELPLKIRRIAKSRRDVLVEEYLGLVEMAPYAARYPHELSGGQQQRVALARTLVYEPVVLLLDEPLSNVDAKLRERARGWFRQMQRKFKLTTVFVTHDQSEALAMSDQIAVMSQGRIVQFGSPAEIYARPGSVFVADFVGSSNVLEGSIRRVLDDGFAEVGIGGHGVIARIVGDPSAGAPVALAIRPERIAIVEAPEAGATRCCPDFVRGLPGRALSLLRRGRRTVGALRMAEPVASRRRAADVRQGRLLRLSQTADEKPPRPDTQQRE